MKGNRPIETDRRTGRGGASSPGHAALKRLLRVIVTGGLLSLILWKIGGFHALVKPIAGVSFPFVIVILLLNTADRLLMSYKWSRLLRLRGIHLPLFKVMRIYCSSMVWGTFLPSTIGADAVRILMAARHSYDRKSLLASVVLERFAGFISALLMGVAGCYIVSKTTDLGPELQVVFWSASAAFIVAALAFALSLSQSFFKFVHERLLSRFAQSRVIEKLRRWHLSYQSYQSHRKELAYFFLLTIVEQLIPIVISWAIARSLGFDVSWLLIAGAFPLALLVSRLPISLNGLGVFEGVFGFLMSLGGVPAAEAVTIALAGRVYQMISWLPWWIVEALGNRTFRAPRQPATDARGT
jgi:uncharacterized protein (TIRG00374 family)